MRAARLPRSTAWLVAAVLTADVAGAVDAANANRPGAYCPLPEKGEISRCLAPAQATYHEFFSALDGDAALSGSVSAGEQAVAQGAGGEEALPRRGAPCRRRASRPCPDLGPLP